jgi:cysteinyl-tRNA synthetase
MQNPMSYSLLDAIGHTPLVEIRKLNPVSNVRILVKLEYMNPGGSIKDRTALSMIEAGEASGDLTPDKTVIEATSGNTGIGLAMVCAVKGYKLVLAMAETASEERRKILKARGADIILTPAELGSDGAIEEAYRLVREFPDMYFMTDQYNNPANWKAHYYGTGPEIWEQTKGRLDMIVATMGTGGTLMGLARRMKAYRPDIRILGVEPYLGHRIQGLKNMAESYKPEIFDKTRLDKKVRVEDEEAFEMTRKLASQEGLFVGMSSGAAMAAAVKEAQAMAEQDAVGEQTLIVIFPDSGERYLSTSLFTVKPELDLKLFNNMTRRREYLKPLISDQVSIYSCGPTVHARMHLGECRRFVFADLLCRYLAYRHFKVNHVVNITDLDDKTIRDSEKAGMEHADFVEHHIDAFKKDLSRLDVAPARRYARVSDHLDDMVELAEKLESGGYAYEKLHSLYFNISSLPEYGRLARLDLSKIKVGATVDLDDYEKDNPKDFTLFKRARLSDLKRGLYVKTRWGNVRPSLHIQCAAIAMKYLGQCFDIHTGSRELIFPHHENEIAIARALTGSPLARYWIHCDNVLAEDGKKMDDRGQRLTLDDMAALGFSGREIRFWLLSAHYRKPLRYSAEQLESVKNTLKKLDLCVQGLLGIESGQSAPELDQILYDLRQVFHAGMDDDLNIATVMAALFKAVKRLNRLTLSGRIDPDGARQALDVFRNMDTVLKIFDFQDRDTDPEVRKLFSEREKARADKNWALADRLRDQLLEMGVTVRDRKI